MSIRRGRFGPYLRAGNVIAGLRKVEPADLTLEMAIDILTARGKEAGGRKGKKGGGHFAKIIITDSNAAPLRCTAL